MRVGVAVWAPRDHTTAWSRTLATVFEPCGYVSVVFDFKSGSFIDRHLLILILVSRPLNGDRWIQMWVTQCGPVRGKMRSAVQAGQSSGNIWVTTTSSRRFFSAATGLRPQLWTTKTTERCGKLYYFMYWGRGERAPEPGRIRENLRSSYSGFLQNSKFQSRLLNAV